MQPRTLTILKASLVGALLIIAVVVAVPRVRMAASSGEEGLRVWFYDQSEQRLYPVPRDTLPPHEGNGGAADDGVRAIVVTCRADAGDPTKRRIAYLETYSPELKKMLGDIQAARAAGRKYNGEMPARDSDFFLKNTLVRRPGEAAWHDRTSAEAATIVSEWRTCNCPDGATPVLCTP